MNNVKLVEKKMRWQDVTIQQLKDKGIDIDENMPLEECAPYMNAFAWGEVVGAGMSVYCSDENNAEVATAFIRFTNKEDAFKFLFSRGWVVTLEGHRCTRFGKGSDIAVLEVCGDQVAYAYTIGVKAEGDKCENHYDKIVSAHIPAHSDMPNNAFERKLANYLGNVSVKAMVGIINQWNINRGALECEQIVSLTHKEDFKLVVDVYGIDIAIDCYSSGDKYLVGSNFEKPKHVDVFGYFIDTYEDIISDIIANSTTYVEWIDFTEVICGK